MPIATKKTFTIDQIICGSTGQPFGPKYAGEFNIRRPSLLDKKNIAVKDAASMSFAGDVVPGMISDGTLLSSYIFSFVTTVAEAALPGWFDMAEMYEEQDEEAIFAVWKEVTAFLDSFRPKNAGTHGKPGDKQPPILVQDKVQPSADGPQVP